ncbi:MAG: Cys-tRNA(Pro) deacylase [Bacteroidales bacterium]|nr:Cys-tRNA(Pro) deacylase [Bacteroidales bacterium]
MAKKKSIKTNVARLLDAARIPYTLIEYPVDEEHLEAQHVADSIGEDINQVYKTLVMRGDKTGLIVGVIPGNREIDLKKAAKASGNKKVEMIHMKELLPLTGYIRGGCSPIGMKKPLPTYFQQDCMEWPQIYVSAGQRGLQVYIAPADLVGYVGGTISDITADSAS